MRKHLGAAVLAAFLVTPVSSPAQQPIDWNAQQETVRSLGEYLRVNTTNPPGSELPDTKPDEFLATLRRVVGDTAVYFAPIPQPKAPLETVLFRAIERAAHDRDPGAFVTTPMLSGATDRPTYRKFGIVTYGFDPFNVEAADAQRGVHGNDERISVENLGFGVHYLYDVLRYAREDPRPRPWPPRSRPPCPSFSARANRHGLPMSAAPALLVRQLRKRYSDVVAVDGLDLEVSVGECFGLLGPNGAGKTTTIEICEGLNSPDEGDVVLLGRRWHTHERELREQLGIQLQETQLTEKLTVAETIALFRSFYHAGRSVDDVIALVQLEEKRNGRVGKLSGGQKQRLALACALVGDPELLFLDEPTTGLDPQSRRQLWDLIESFKAMGRTILLTTHYMDEAERLCDRVAIVDHGRVIALGTPRELIGSLGVEHVVEFAIAHGDGRLDADTLQGIEGVRTVRRVADAWELAVAETHRAIPALLAVLDERQLELVELRTHSATLEDVFVHLTGRQLRDE